MISVKVGRIHGNASLKMVYSTFCACAEFVYVFDRLFTNIIIL
jgi:hypothetical protein